MAIRKVNAITGPGCAEAQDGQLSASGIRASAAPEGEHKGVRQRNTFGAERRLCPAAAGGLQHGSCTQTLQFCAPSGRMARSHREYDRA